MSVAPRPSSPVGRVVAAVLRLPITSSLLLASVVISFAAWSSPGFDPFITDSSAFFYEPWRIATAQLAHLDEGHLFGNAILTWILGRALEPRLGRPGFGALLAFVTLGMELGCRAFDRDGIGLSGIVYGLWAFLAVGSWRMPALRGLVTLRTHVWFVIWFFVCVALTMANIWPISNWGHGLGALLGAIAALCIGPELRWSTRTALLPAIVLVLLFVGATFLRETVNFGAGATADAEEGVGAIERGDPIAARARYESALRIGPPDAETWWELARIAHGLEEHEAAADAAFRSFELGMRDEENRAWTRDALTMRAVAEDEAGRPDRALAEALRAARVAPELWEMWDNVRILGERVGDAEAVQRATFEQTRLGGRR